jgi:hypothetical protein
LTMRQVGLGVLNDWESLFWMQIYIERQRC